MTKKTMMLVLVALLTSPVIVHAATWQEVPLIDSMCSSKFEDDTAEHTVSCAIQCAGSGYGILVDGQFVKFDRRGNELALEALKETTREKDIRVTVEGDLAGDTIEVVKLSIN